MIVKREREIQAFVPEPYWLVHATLRPALRGPLVRGRRDADRQATAAERADAIVGKVSGKDGHGRVGRAQGAVRARAAPLRPDLAPARREPPLRLLRAPHAAGRAVALRGQEGDHLPAYVLALPLRRHGPAAEADGRDAGADPEYAARAPQFVLALDQLPLGRVVNDAKVERPPRDHPDRRRARPRAFSPDERRIFDLVARALPRRLPSAGALRAHDGRHARRGGALPDARQDHARGRVARRLRRSRPTRSGRPRTRPRGGELPPLEEGQTVRCVAAESEAKETRPPPRYTEATLLSAMETAGKLIDDEELREAMKESRPRHAGDARRDDRDADPPRVHRARRQGPAGRRRRASR